MIEASDAFNDTAAPELGVAAAELRLAIGSLYRQLKERGVTELSWSKGAILGWLERDGPQTVSQLARAEGMKPQSMSTAVALLEEAGYVTRVADSADKRASLVTISASGRVILDSGRRERVDWLVERMSALSLSDQHKLVDAAAVLKHLAID